MNRTKMSPMLAAVLAAILTLAVLSACSSASPTSSSSPSTSPAASAVSADASAKPAGSEEQAYQNAQANWQQVVTAAQKEEQPANFYSINEQDSLNKWQDAFNKNDPKIQVKFTRMTGAVATERFKAEQATKQYVGNLYLGGSPSSRSIAAQGLGQAIEDLPAMYEPGVKWITAPNFDKPNGTITAGFIHYFIMVNTSVVPADQEPKTWSDLADPKWKDKLILWDPRLAGTGQAVIGTLYSNPNYGPELVKKILDNARVVQDPSDPRLVAKGDYALGIASWTNYLSVKDAPVKVINPTDGVIATPMQFIVSKTAPQLNTTKVFLNWILSKDGQNIVGQLYSTIRPDVASVTKETQVDGARLLKNVPATFEFETVQVKEMVQVISKWMADMGK